MTRRTVKVDGNVARLLKVAPVGKELCVGYIDRFSSASRQDPSV